MAFPFVVLACAVTLSLSAQVVEAERSPIGWIAAAIPALGFLVMVKIALGHTSTTATGGLGTAAPSAADDADAEPPSLADLVARQPGSRSRDRVLHARKQKVPGVGFHIVDETRAQERNRDRLDGKER